MNKKIPFDFKASLNMPMWHKDFTNVVNEEDVNVLLKQQNENIVKYIKSLKNNDKRDNFLLSLPSIMDRVNGYIIALLAIQGCDKNNLELASTLGEVNFLKTGDKKYLENKTKIILSEKPIRTYFIRRVVRTLTWIKWWKLPLTIFKPDIIAVGHNEILIQKARKSKQRIYFYQASELLRNINKNNIEYQKSEYFDDLPQETYQALIGNLEIEVIYLERFNQLVNSLIKECLLRDAKALYQCSQYSKLPKNIWIGTGTAYSFRLLALAVLRNGGSVTSFTHATGSVLAPSCHRMYYGEFAVTNNFVDITPKAKEFFYKNYLKQFPVSINQPFNISSIIQNNKFEKYQNYAINKNKRPVVIYMSTAIREFSLGAAISNDMVYLKWQLNLTDILDKMNIDLICQPHPEGVFKDKTLIHPLLRKYNLPNCSFETIMQKADVFLIDYIHSTTVGEMLVTEKPIVRIGWGDNSVSYGVSERLKPLLNNRCRNIQAKFDESGLPVIDEKKLENALTHNWKEKVNSTEFKELLIGRLK